MNKRNNKNGFTLVELLAVIVILAIILVIAVPKVMDIINDAKKGTLESTAKMIASQAEKQKVQNVILGKDEKITCDSVTKLNDVDYESCNIIFNNDEAQVTITGSGKFDNLYVCNGTKTSAEATNVECPFVCFGYESTIEKIDVTIPYVVKDVDSCINYLKENFLNYWGYLNESGIESLCNGGTVYDDPDYYDISVVINELKNNDVLTEKELIENNVIEGSIEEETVCVPNYAEDAVTYINNLYNDTNVRNKFGLTKDNTSKQNIRYAGQYVQNYVEFGNANELWRIIGVFEVEKASGGTEELVKIVRDEPFKDSEGILWMSWDSSASTINYGYGVNEWSQADLKTTLNTYYIGNGTSCTYCNSNMQATCSNSCNSTLAPIGSTYTSMIENVVWNTGAIEWSEELTPLEAYNVERGSTTGKICTQGNSSCNDTVTRTTEWEGKVGLIYPSDWGYASADSNCGDITDFNGICYRSNWLYTGKEDWTISPQADSGSAYGVWRVGAYASSGIATGVNSVRPALYLKSNVQIIGGDGSKNNPYKLT